MQQEVTDSFDKPFVIIFAIVVFVIIILSIYCNPYDYYDRISDVENILSLIPDIALF